MRSILRMRHYCDFCKKSTGTKNSMVKHEGSCTNNPGRVCRMCSFAGLAQQPMEALVKAYVTQGRKALHDLSEGCPACILAAVRQTTPEQFEQRPDADDYRRWNPLDDLGEWEFRKACNDFLEDHRPEELERYY